MKTLDRREWQNVALVIANLGNCDRIFVEPPDRTKREDAKV
jgi:hypothetical protein